MKRIALIVAIVLSLIPFVPLPAASSTLELGIGGAYFTKSQQTVPAILAQYNFTARRDAAVIWAKDQGTNHALGLLEFRVGEAPFELGHLFVAFGGGAAWRNFDAWKAELAVGGGLGTQIGIFKTKFGYLHAERGGETVHPTNLFYLGAFVGAK